MIRKDWIDPNEIYLAKVMNPRLINQGFVQSLVESMKEQGFLPQYPVKVFAADALTCVETDLPFACVSGMHRTSAAQIAKIDEILCEVHPGDDDAFIEMMMTDNFEYDPARNSELGQVFSQREKRKACQRLLYIPKFLRMTNSALAEEWHTNEANIRRWRKEVVAAFDVQNVASSNDEGGAPTFPETLSRVGITPERLNELKEIHDSREREDADGNTVQVRKPRPDASEDDKEKFFETIRTDFHDLRDDEFNEVIDFDWDAVKRYAGKKWNVDVRWRMYEDMHIDQLRKLHKLILENDADFISACSDLYEAVNAAIKLKDDMEKAVKKTVRLFCKLIGADNEYDDRFKSKWDVFEGMVKSQLNIEMFGRVRWDYSDLETADEYRTVIAQHKTVQEAIGKEAEWIAEFMKKEQAAAAEKRKKVSAAWTKKRDAAITAINEYERDVSFDRIISEAEKQLYKSHGYFNKIFDAESVSSKKNIGTLEDEVKSLDRLINAVKKDVEWVAEIPAVKSHETVTPVETETTTANLDKHLDRLIASSNVVNDAILGSEDSWFFAGDKADFALICDRAAEVLACDRDLLFKVMYDEEIPDEFGVAEIAKWDTILRQIHAAIEAKAVWIMEEPGKGGLYGIALEDIFQHVADRVIHIPVDDENQVMSDMAILLGKASRGQRGTQLYLLMKFALFLQPKSDIEGVEIEKEMSND